MTGVVSAAAAEATGLAPGTPVVAGGGDQAATAVGVGAVDPGIVALSLGTSGVIFAATDRPLIEPEGRVHAFCHAVPDRWHLMSVMLSAAGSLRWFRDALAPGVPYATLDEEASHVAPGSDGLVFLPYLTGERSPHPDPLARGAFVGLTVTPRSTPPRACRARGRCVRAARWPRPDGGDRDRDTDPHSGIGRGHRQRGVAPDPGRRPRSRDRHGQHLGGRRVRCRPPGGGRGGLVRHRRAGRRVRRSSSTVVAEPGPDASVYAEGLEAYRALYPALAPSFRRASTPS